MPAILFPLLIQLAAAPGPVSGANDPPAPFEAGAGNEQGGPISEDNLLFFAVILDSATLTESLITYGDPADPLLPVGELARMLELDISLSPQQGIVTGTLGESRRPLTIDIGLSAARTEGETIPIPESDAARTGNEIFIRASLLQRLLPIRIEVSPEALLIRLTATEKLPVQARVERQRRLEGVSAGSLSGVDAEPAMQIETPYRLFSPPAFDVTMETGVNGIASPQFPIRYDVRMAGDLARMGYQAYLGSDEHGRPVSSRILFERRSRDGGLLGPLDATHFSLGDTFTPSLSIGPRSASGRGFGFSTAPLTETSVFQRITLRGELPIGYDVELYINDILVAGQQSPVEGRYEFIDVPLVRGLNVIRIVSYGPRGERGEQTRVINVGGGQLARGKWAFDFGIVEQDRPLIDLRDKTNPGFFAREGRLRAVATAAYGLSENVTLIGNAAIYPDITGNSHTLIGIGARGSLFGMAAQADAAADLEGGHGVSLGLAGNLFGLSMLARHSEYSGGFADETVGLESVSRPLTRHSELTVDTTLPRLGSTVIPLSTRLIYDAYRNGDERWALQSRASAAVAEILFSGAMEYRWDRYAEGPNSDQLAGSVAASKFLNYIWQIRGIADFVLVPKTELRSLSLTVTRDLSATTGLRFGLGKSFGSGGSLNMQGGLFFRFPFADLSIDGNYETSRNDWRIGIRLAFGIAYDPWARDYRLTRPGPASGGSASLYAFMDDNGNGLFDAGEAPVPDLEVFGGEMRSVRTGADGRALVNGLGNTSLARLRVATEEVESFYVSTPPENVEFSSRPGQTVAIPYPLAPIGEVFVNLRMVQENGNVIGISAVRLRLVRDEGEAIEGMTEYDGSLYIGDIRPGGYRIEIDPDQAARLGMRLKEPVTVTVVADQTVQVDAEVVFEKGV